MTQFEFYKSFQFVVELLLATLIYVYPLKKRKLFPLRLGFCILACFLFAFVLPLPKALINNPFYCSLIFVGILVFMILMSKIVFNESWTVLSFCGVAGYTTQHLCYELYSLAMNALQLNDDMPLGFYGDEFTTLFTNPFQLALYVLIYAVTIFVCYALFSNKIDLRQTAHLKFSFIFIFSIFILVIDILLNAVIVFWLSSERLSVIIAEIYNILCCVIALYLQFEVALKRQIETELVVERKIHEQVKEQYAISKQSVDLINTKFHDVKHQIRQLTTGETVPASVLRELAHNITLYDSISKTGNDALDVILTEKSFLCNTKNIQLDCIVDGKQLSFIRDEDVYALFGNIIDNAIEAVLQLDEGMRTISLQVKRINNILTIHQSNHYAKINIENGEFKTTKSDKLYHGYGLRSIRRICEQYGGDLTISTDDNIFSLSILFFVQEQE